MSGQDDQEQDLSRRMYNAMNRIREQDGWGPREKFFVKEDRYIVLKRKQVQAALSRHERQLLNELCAKVSSYRMNLGKQPLICVVVESDWPEYAEVWDMIKARTMDKK